MKPLAIASFLFLTAAAPVALAGSSCDDCDCCRQNDCCDRRTKADPEVVLAMQDRSDAMATLRRLVSHYVTEDRARAEMLARLEVEPEAVLRHPTITAAPFAPADAAAYSVACELIDC